MEDKYILIKFGTRSGKIELTLESGSDAMLYGWAMYNTTKTKSCIVFRYSDGKIFHTITGTQDFPKLRSYKDGDLGNIENICPGLLDALKREDMKK